MGYIFNAINRFSYKFIAQPFVIIVINQSLLIGSNYSHHKMQMYYQ